MVKKRTKQFWFWYSDGFEIVLVESLTSVNFNEHFNKKCQCWTPVNCDQSSNCMCNFHVEVNQLESLVGILSRNIWLSIFSGKYRPCTYLAFRLVVIWRFLSDTRLDLWNLEPPVTAWFMCRNHISYWFPSFLYGSFDKERWFRFRPHFNEIQIVFRFKWVLNFSNFQVRQRWSWTCCFPDGEITRAS